MRIVYVLNSLDVGGAERQVLALAGRMATRGHDVALLVLRPREADGFHTSLEVVHLDILKNTASVIRGMRRGVGLLRGFRPEIVHSHNFHGNILARLMRVLCPGPKLISTIHNVYEGGWGRMLAYGLSDGLADRVTAVSTAVGKRYVRMKAVQQSKCIVITNGIDTVEFAPNGERRAVTREKMSVADEFVWLFAGRPSPAKDIPNLMQAFGRVGSLCPQTQLWMAGGTSHQAKEGDRALVGFTARGGRLDQVRWLGLRSDIAALLDAADGFVLSSAWEGMPLALGEAMAIEKPVVATDVGGVRELVGEAGMIVPAKDPKALAAAMLETMRRPREERAALGRAARERICAQFDMDAKTDTWEAIYRSVLA